jgi:N-acetylmuramoyl-L-alanine amidase
MKIFKLTIFILLLTSFNLSFSQVKNKIKLALDPMHGGYDEGFFDQKTNTFEKDITLAVTQKIIEILNSYEEYEIIKLRNSDVFVPMSDKILMASELNANLYVAINCQTDADLNKRGTQLFTLNKNSDENAINLAKKENEVIKKENGSEIIFSDYKENDPNKIFDAVKIDKKYLQLSKDFTTIIRNELNEKRKFNDNGIVEGPFLMLHNVYMPSAIINIGYLSNKEDLEYLKSSLGQQIIAEAIVNSIIGFKNKLDNDKFDLDKFLKPEQKIITQEDQINISKSRINTTNDNKSKQFTQKPNKTNNSVAKKTKSDQGKTNSSISNRPSKERKTNSPKEDLGSDSDSKYSSSKYYGTKELLYRVQILACYTCPSLSKKVLNKYSNIIKIHEEGYKKYFIFETLNLEEAKAELLKAKEQGFTDAFIVGYKGKEKIKID